MAGAPAPVAAGSASGGNMSVIVLILRFFDEAKPLASRPDQKELR